MDGASTKIRGFTLRTSDKVLLGVVAVLAAAIIALGIMSRCGLQPVNALLPLQLPLVALAAVLGWLGWLLVRRIKRRTVRWAVGGGLLMILLLILTLVFTYISYMGFYVLPQRYGAVVSPSGARRLVVLRTLDGDDDRIEQRRQARLAAEPDGNPEITERDWGQVYRAYPQVLGRFYRSNADVEGEVYLAIDESMLTPEEETQSASEGEAGSAGAGDQSEPEEEAGNAPAEERSAHRGTLMVEWLEDETVAHFYVDDPGTAEGGDCYVRFKAE